MSVEVEIKIDGYKHRLVESSMSNPCSVCSLWERCQDSESFCFICEILRTDGYFEKVEDTGGGLFPVFRREPYENDELVCTFTDLNEAQEFISVYGDKRYTIGGSDDLFYGYEYEVEELKSLVDIDKVYEVFANGEVDYIGKPEDKEYSELNVVHDNSLFDEHRSVFVVAKNMEEAIEKAEPFLRGSHAVRIQHSETETPAEVPNPEKRIKSVSVFEAYAYALEHFDQAKTFEQEKPNEGDIIIAFYSDDKDSYIDNFCQSGYKTMGNAGLHRVNDGFWNSFSDKVKLWINVSYLYREGYLEEITGN